MLVMQQFGCVVKQGRTMKITDQAELDRIGAKANELQDGLFVFAHQGRFVLDTHVCIGTDVPDDQFYFVTEYQDKAINDPERHEVDLCNVSFLSGHFDFMGEYDQTSVCAYTTRQEMMDHINRFMVERNHY